MPPRRSARLAAAAAEPEPGSESDSVYYTDGASDGGGEDEEEEEDEGEEGASDDDDDDDASADDDDDDDDDASDDDSSSSSSSGSEASREEQTDWMRKVAADALMLYNPLASSSGDADAATPQVWRAVATKHARGVEPRSRPGPPAMRVRGVRTPQDVTYRLLAKRARERAGGPRSRRGDAAQERRRGRVPDRGRAEATRRPTR